MQDTVLLEVTNNVAIITFNRPQAMNSFNEVMGEELEVITNRVRADKKIRAVMLRGGGALFMAGGDIRYFSENLSKMSDVVMHIVRRLNASIHTLMYMPKPVLGCVHGSVAGVGVSLMMACDLVIAADNTKFTTAYAGLGVPADGGATYNLPRHVGVKKTMELLMLAEVFDAKTALELRLVNWLVPAENLAVDADKILQRLAKGPTTAYAQIKKLVNQSFENSLSTQLELEGKSFEKCAETQDFKNGVNAFLQKKQPEFLGN